MPMNPNGCGAGADPGRPLHGSPRAPGATLPGQAACRPAGRGRVGWIALALALDDLNSRRTRYGPSRRDPLRPREPRRTTRTRATPRLSWAPCPARARVESLRPGARRQEVPRTRDERKGLLLSCDAGSPKDNFEFHVRSNRFVYPSWPAGNRTGPTSIRSRSRMRTARDVFRVAMPTVTGSRSWGCSSRPVPGHRGDPRSRRDPLAGRRGASDTVMDLRHFREGDDRVREVGAGADEALAIGPASAVRSTTTSPPFITHARHG